MCVFQIFHTLYRHISNFKGKIPPFCFGVEPRTLIDTNLLCKTNCSNFSKMAASVTFGSILQNRKLEKHKDGDEFFLKRINTKDHHFVWLIK